jgi:hypothetical protein
MAYFNDAYGMRKSTHLMLSAEAGIAKDTASRIQRTNRRIPFTFLRWLWYATENRTYAENYGLFQITADPLRTDNLQGKKVAWFSCKTVLAECEKAGITDPAQVKSMSVIATNGTITVFEFSYVGK